MLTQKKLAISLISKYGSIVPARMCGNVYCGTMAGSDFPRRCRELRAEGILRSEGDKRFERFYLVEE